MSYKVKQEDLIGNIAGFPIEVVQAMVDEQVRQGYNADVKVFQKCRTIGFVWSESFNGKLFWQQVLQNKNFDLFFQHYPKLEVATESIDPMSLIPELGDGVEMEFSVFGEEWQIGKILAKYKGVYIANHGSGISIVTWDLCRPIQKPVKLTRQEIADKFGIDTNFIIEE